MRIAKGCLRTVRHASSVLASTFILLAPTIAHAQVTTPPQPALNRSPAAWIGYLLIMILLAMVVGISLLPSKRGHQD